MYYHCVAALGGKKRRHRWRNQSKNSVISRLLIPFLNGHIIEGKMNGQKALVNMKAVDHFVIFKTRNKLTSAQIEKFRKYSRVGTVCTSELIKEVRFDKSTEQTKSLLELLMRPVKHQIFVIMKFNDDHLDSAYEGVIRPVAESFGFDVLRIDEEENSKKITAQIIERIAESEIILADLTGSKPNCYFETGIALASGKEVILSIKNDEKPHFDLLDNRFIMWKTENDLRRKLEKRLDAIVGADSF